MRRNEVKTPQEIDCLMEAAKMKMLMDSVPNLTAIRVSVIWSTTNYDIFEFDEQNNRSVNTEDRRFGELVAEIGMNEQVHSIVVSRPRIDENGNVKVKVLSGQHRLQAAIKAGVPIEFTIDPRENMTALDYVQAEAYLRPHTGSHFADLGKGHGVEILAFAKKLLVKVGKPFSWTEILESAVTIVKGREVYRNTRFSNDCRQSLRGTFEELGVYNITPKIEKEVEQYFTDVREIISLLGKRTICIHSNRALLELRIGKPAFTFTFSDFLEMMRDPANEDLRQLLKAANTEDKTRKVLVEFDKRYLLTASKKAKVGTSKGRKASKAN